MLTKKFISKSHLIHNESWDKITLLIPHFVENDIEVMEGK